MSLDALDTDDDKTRSLRVDGKRIRTLSIVRSYAHASAWLSYKPPRRVATAQFQRAKASNCHMLERTVRVESRSSEQTHSGSSGGRRRQGQTVLRDRES